MKRDTFYWNYGQHQMFGQSWTVENARAQCLLIHGMGEHSGRYPAVVEMMNAEGINVHGFDHIGHGMSNGKRGHVANYDELLNSTATFCERLLSESTLPLYMYAHSMGGNVGLSFLMKKNYPFQAAVISAPWLRLPKEPPKLQVKLGRLMLKYWPDMQNQTKLDTTLISRDQREVKKYETDALVHGYITPAFYFGVEAAGEWLLAHAADLKTPVLLIQGSDDGITSIKATEEFARNSRGMAEMMRWDKFYHELHNDYGKEKVMAAVADWLRRH